MGRSIIKLADKYLVWSSIVDAPITYGMTKEELEEFIEWQHGQDGLRDLPERLKRVEQKGTSAFGYKSVEEQVAFNRAGPKESNLTIDELIEQFVTNPKETE